MYNRQGLVGLGDVQLTLLLEAGKESLDSSNMHRQSHEKTKMRGKRIYGTGKERKKRLVPV
jgi:ssDNA-specific exonuclease RecJ